VLNTLGYKSEFSSKQTANKGGRMTKLTNEEKKTLALEAIANCKARIPEITPFQIRKIMSAAWRLANEQVKGAKNDQPEQPKE
jgi:hypothetical protein